jgi:hypothetical protein
MRQHTATNIQTNPKRKRFSKQKSPLKPFEKTDSCVMNNSALSSAAPQRNAKREAAISVRAWLIQQGSGLKAWPRPELFWGYVAASFRSQ